ncbi:hypothetical protein S7711_04641 [Stachybotrys chartarum IBT 7711]|uniref:N-acetyltransferase domain-containing protein n=1 Tax=Stachybotrys chartarum (strain CBS 109288 / IBT 7711) TaxID=1280523 RepID=A0A084AUJ9_STACB|nr:hypothetical protein S7711_04641 [Stachybotrys chartarum IBT 7711]KFA52021.1 hypothetical protein S40293_02960 [Stachybotrys chartarum IBT 40293]KFA73385.1 hypothetical protein S40288_09032 [Stachybotrys chartarum IBT 40288]
MSAPSSAYRLRAGRASDTYPATLVWAAAFDHDTLLDVLFPQRRSQPENVLNYVHRLFQMRYWSIDYTMEVLADEQDKIVGLTWWRAPADAISFYKKWLSPHTWFVSVVRAYLQTRDCLFPLPSFDEHSFNAFSRAMETIKPQIMNSDHRRQAVYLSTLAVQPSLQGQGLGGLLLRQGLQRADQQGRATWLVGSGGTDRFYGRFGFVEVARCNIGELRVWDGGIVMFRE